MSQLFGIAFWTCLVVYALSVAVLIHSLVFTSEKRTRLATWGVAAGLVLHTLLVGWRWVQVGHVPTIGNFENTLVGAWFIVAMTLWAAWRHRYPLVAAGALPIALVLLGGGAMADVRERPMIASLQSSWLFIHIFFAWLAFGAYTVACGTGIAYLVKTRKSAEPPSSDWLERLDELMFRCLVFGFITDTIMIAAGAIWAKNLWGSYWSWDPVETWSLLSWLIYGVCIHLRLTLRWRGRRLAWLVVFAIIGVLVSFFGVNLVMQGSDHLFNMG
jgi:cytochrome c-type biogenesis protein CcsB